ncbi:MAG TPA: hypothetical protein VFM69_06360 [Pricia sp.]|nr:hypothetical protein [Pricia sp.]
MDVVKEKISDAIGDRIEEVMNDHGLNYRSLAAKMKKSDTGVGNVAKGSTIPRYDFIKSFMEVFPDVNGHWLLTGNGNKTGDYKVMKIDDYSVREISEFVVTNQKKFLTDAMFREFLDKLTFKRMLEIEGSGE